jgi:hypothetical protein
MQAGVYKPQLSHGVNPFVDRYRSRALSNDPAASAGAIDLWQCNQ